MGEILKKAHLDEFLKAMGCGIKAPRSRNSVTTTYRLNGPPTEVGTLNYRMLRSS